MVAFFIEGLAEVLDYFNAISMYVVANFMGCRNSSCSQRCCCFEKCEFHINQHVRLLVGWLVRLVDGWLVVGHHDFLKAQRSCTSRSPIIGELVIFNPIHKVLVASSPKFTNNVDFSDHFKQEGPYSERLRKQSARDGRLERCMHLKSSKPSTRENLIGK